MVLLADCGGAISHSGSAHSGVAGRRGDQCLLTGHSNLPSPASPITKPLTLSDLRPQSFPAASSVSAMIAIDSRGLLN